jgi:hypothetical protein
MLKKFKIITLAPTCFGSRRNHNQGAVLCLAKTTKYDFSVLVGIDVVNVMAAYQPVVQACGSQWRQFPPPHLHNRLICLSNTYSSKLLYPDVAVFFSPYCNDNFSLL